ncbi:MAG: DUF3352 domain-containing protein [Actinomycetota bacterium]|nr:DUF3352 domain-containing protein [Actinomycetota bacterium]MDQ2958197.1 DUF3352 domain-containing protein [Actinomycetota bacterium]
MSGPFGDQPANQWQQPPITEVTSPDGQWEPAGQWEPTWPTVLDGVQPGPQFGYYPPAPVSPPTPPERGRRRWMLASLMSLLLLLIGGGGIASYQVLNGGGTQPDEVIPASAVAFAKLDLNPSASQKIAAARLLNRIPKLGGFSGSGDWREAMFRSLSDNGSLPAGVQFDRDIKPWLGKRLAVALLPTLADGAPEVLVAAQTTDEAQARVGIARFGTDYGVSFYRGYAVIARSQQVADEAVSSAKVASLASARNYVSDMQQVGSLGVASGWVDLTAAGKLSGSTSSGVLAVGGGGRLAFTTRFAGNNVDLVIKMFGTSPSAGSATALPDIGALPASTAIGAAFSNAGSKVDQQWQGFLRQLSAQQVAGGPSPSDMIDSLQRESGISLPGDLVTLLGSELTLSVDADGLDAGNPKVAIRTKTDGPAAVRVLDKISRTLHLHHLDFPLFYGPTSDGLIAASDQQYLASLGSPSGPRLSGVAGFRAALPELAGASAAAFVNFDAITAALRSNGANPGDLTVLSSLSALGMTVHSSGAVSTISIRLVMH